MMTGTQQPYDLPPEECVVLVCSYIESLLEAARTRATNSALPPQMKSTTPPPAPTLPTPPDDTQPAPPRRSAEYVAERPNGEIHPVVGEEYGIGVGYDSVDLQRQRERIALRFSSKTIPKIPLSDYLDRYAITNGHADGRIRKYNDVRTPMLLSLAIYLDRIEFPILNELNVHRFVLSGLRIAAKFLEDLVWKHDRYSKVVGVSSRELSRLELGLILLCNY
jgi:hypothetical protein